MDNESDFGSLQRHPDFWFDDGSIVVCVEDTAFKVHRSLLARQSEIFADLFSLPQPPDADRIAIEGCPIVHLPDRRSDFIDLLKALYNPLHFDTLPEPTLTSTLDFIEGILRLSTKYFIPSLRTKCLSLIEALGLCASTLDQADFVYDRDQLASQMSSLLETSSKALILRLRRGVVQVIRLILLAQESNTADVFQLPFLYYIVATRMEPDQLLVPGTVGLSYEEKLLCMVAREKLHLAWKDCYAFLHRFETSKKCVTECSLPKGVLSEWLRIKDSVQLDPLQPYSKRKTLGVCRFCLEHATLRYTTARQQLWNRLPSLFNLPKWIDDS